MEYDPGSIQQILIIIVLVAVNAFFAASEMAIVSVNKNKIATLAEGGDKRAQMLEKILDDPNRFLSTIQVGITFAGFLSSAFAASNLSKPLADIMSSWNVPVPSSQTFSIIIITIILSYFTLVFGELIPKRVALQQSEFIALKSIKVINFVSKVTGFFVKILSVSTNFFLRLLKIDTEKMEEKVTEEEINRLLEVGQKHGLINKTGKDMIESVFLFDDKLAKDVMTARRNVFFIDVNKPFSEYYDEYFDLLFSRVPVYEDDIDNIIGILYMKDLLTKAYQVGFDNINIREIIQESYFTSERKNIDALFKEMQKNKTHIAILLDEYGVVTGIVTMEDLVEEIVGEIEDEYDEYDEIIKLNEYTYLVKGYVTISDLNEALDLELDENNDDYDTVAGLMIEYLGDLPENTDQDTVIIDDMIFKIAELSENRIETIKLLLRKDREREDDESAI